MRFLVDAQLPPAPARRLVERGHIAGHVGHCGLAGAADDVIWRHATTIGATILTKDEDSAGLKLLREEGPPVVWIRLRNTRRQELLDWFDVILPDLVRALARGGTFVEIARDPSQ